MPSLRELHLLKMHTGTFFKNNVKKNLITRTYFYNKYIAGFGYDSTTGNVILTSSHGGFVLPVQDVYD